MSQSLAKIYLHVVFSTKERRPFLHDRDLREDMFAYLAGAFNGLDSPAILVGGTEDHIHALCRLSKNIAPKDLIAEVKRESSKWVKLQQGGPKDFYWQNGYGVFSLSPSHVDPTRNYIATQEEHHRQTSFKDEFRRLCRKYDVEIDERYVWD